MSKKTKTTSSETKTVTPTNPQWVTDGAQGLSQTIMNLGTKDPKSYVADADPLQTLAAQGATNLTTSPYFGQAADMFTKAGTAGANTYNPVMGQASSMSAASLLDGLGNYMSPYTKDVVDTTLADFDYNAGQQQAQAQLDEARSGAFGGSGAAITRSMLGDSLARARASAAAGLRDQAFNTGAGLSAQDAGFRQQAAATNAANANAMAMANMQAQNQAGQFNAGAQDTALSRLFQAGSGLAGLGAQQGQEDRANVALQGDLGAQLRQIAQAKAGADISLAGAQTGMFGGLPTQLFRGETSNGTSTSTSKTSDPMAAIGTLGALALAPFTGGASLMGVLGGMGGLGAGLAGAAGGAAAAGAVPTAASLGIFSDLRLKRNVETVGYDDKGRRVVDFEYIWSPQVHRGYIAQEILQSDPHAVHMDDSGFLKVNYGALA